MTTENRETVKHFYGCVHCRKYHYEGQPVFKEHYWWQTVHGIKEISEREWAVEMLKSAQRA